MITILEYEFKGIAAPRAPLRSIFTGISLVLTLELMVPLLRLERGDV